MKIAKQIEQLRETIRRHERLYYVEAITEISDFEFDQLMRQLIELEDQHPELRTSDSPSARVGGEPRKGEFVTVTHQPPMLSIENAYSFEELDEWHQRLKKSLESETVHFLAELKIDGLSIDLLYQRGELVRAATRGDGTRGDDVTANARTIRGLPLRIDRDFELLQIRGEIYISKKNFQLLNQQIEEDGAAPLANARNAAAGSLRLKDPKAVAARKLSTLVYQIVRADEIEVRSQSEAFEVLTRLGFPTNPGRRVCKSLDEVKEFIEEWRTGRDDLPFEIDGIVVKVDDRRLQQELGSTSKAPRWVVAFKYPPEATETIVREITCQVGRTGTITPVANFDPVIIGGSTVRRATLHNFDELARKDIRIGDTVRVEKGGDVIPKVTGVVLERRPFDSQPMVIPDVCPVCSQQVHRFEGEVAIRCANQGCPAIARESILHFTSRKAMNIDGVGEKIVDTFLEQELVADYSSLYTLREEQLTNLERWGETSARKLLEQIERSKSSELERLIFGLGIRFVGERAAKILAEHYKSITALMDSKPEELVEIPEIGPKVAESIVFYFSVPANRSRIVKLMELGLNPTVVDRRIGNALEGKTLVVTGTLSRFKRDEIHALIEAHGGKASGSVSSRTSYVIAGEEAGSKLEKAKALKVPVLSEDDFENLIAGS